MKTRLDQEFGHFVSEHDRRLVANEQLLKLHPHNKSMSCHRVSREGQKRTDA